MALSVAGHVTTYAVQRFNLRGLIRQADINRAQDATYEFLKWKLGNPSAERYAHPSYACTPGASQVTLDLGGLGNVIGIR